tara:strand:+ start:1037 stop:1567 length:531 start_codon:yes stop_codon:yes gene_type:complete
MPAQWVNNQPSNRNFLSPVGFQLEIDIFPQVDFFCQTATIPDITSVINEVSTPRRRLPIPAAGGTTFGDLQVEFLVDEDLKNYLSIWNWINDTTLAYDTEPWNKDPEVEFAKAQLIVLTNQLNPNFQVNFVDLFPVSLSMIPFNVTNTDVEFMRATATFKYAFYEFLDMSSVKYVP